MAGIAQDRPGGQHEADERSDDESCVARHDLEVRTEGEEQGDDARGSPEDPEQVQAPLLRHDQPVGRGPERRPVTARTPATTSAPIRRKKTTARTAATSTVVGPIGSPKIPWNGRMSGSVMP